MPENNQLLSVEGQLVGMPLAGPESFSQQQLDYLKRALGVDETVLWEGAGTSGTAMNLSETAKNFERIRIFGHENNRGRGCVQEFNPSVVTDSNTLVFCLNLPDIPEDKAWYGAYSSVLKYSSTSCTSITNSGGYQWFTTTGSTKTTEVVTTRYIIVDKVVGIHRIAGGN